MERSGYLLGLALFLLLAGCGGGGQTASSGGSGGDTVSTGGEPAIPPGFGVIRLNFTQAGASAPEDVRSLVAVNEPLPAPDNVRIAARRITTEDVTYTDDEGNDITVTVTHEVFRKIVDINWPAPSVSIAVPAADNYVVEVLSSKIAYDNVLDPRTYYHTMLKYAKLDDVDVLAGQTTQSPSIVAQPIAGYLTIGLPVLSGQAASVVSGNPYAITVSWDNVPFRRPYHFQQFVDDISNGPPPSPLFVSATSPSFTSNVTFTPLYLTVSPASAIYWNLYIQSLFFIDDSWKADTDPVNWWRQWRFYYPNPTTAFGDPPLLLKLFPLGTVDIIITL